MAGVAGRTETLVMRYHMLETTADDVITDAVREAAVDLARTVFSQDAALAGGDWRNAPTTAFGLPAD